MTCDGQWTIMKGSLDTISFGWLWPSIPNHAHTRLDLLQVQGKKREREGEGKMLGRHFIWLKEDLEAVRVNIADNGYCKIKGIRKLHQIITKPNKHIGAFIREYMDFYVMSATKVKLKVVRLQSQINILDTVLMF